MKSIFGASQTIPPSFPRQFWLILSGMLLAETGSSLIWPFMTIYIRQTLNIPLAVAASLITISSITTLFSSFFAGPLVDRFGRKSMMVIGLVMVAIVFLSMSFAQSLTTWFVIMFIRGLFIPVYRVGADAMVADLTTPINRQQAYSLVRMVGNAGIAIGPSVGGFLVVQSYTTSFFSGAIAFFIFSLIILFFVKETLPHLNQSSQEDRKPSGYGLILKDHPFLSLVGIYTLTIMGSAVVMLLMSVYAKENFNIPESQYGFIMATNALMVVVIQYPVNAITRKFQPLPVLAIGTVFYTIGIASVSIASSFWSFWICMVILTIGELIMSPTATTLVANIAPQDMRGRYMSIFGLAWGIGVGAGPVIAGYFSDRFYPTAMWHVGAIFALLSGVSFLILNQVNRKKDLFQQNVGSRHRFRMKEKGQSDEHLMNSSGRR